MTRIISESDWIFINKYLPEDYWLTNNPPKLLIPPDANDLADKEMLDWLEEQVKKSYSGVTIEASNGMYRFMRRHYISEWCNSLRAAINLAKYTAEGGPFSKDK